MLYRKIIAVYCQNYMGHTFTEFMLKYVVHIVTIMLIIIVKIYGIGTERIEINNNKWHLLPQRKMKIFLFFSLDFCNLITKIQ